jgi:hypothetical protein
MADTETDRDVARAALHHAWGARWDTGYAGGQWHAMRLDGTGELISAATPDELDAMIKADEAPSGHL